MKRQSLVLFFIINVFIFNTCMASPVVTINDWTYRSDLGDVGVPLFRVTMTFTPAVDLEGINNKYEYRVDNLTSDLTASIFRVANPDDLAKTTNEPLGWGQVPDSQNFYWYSTGNGYMIEPGQMVEGFEILTPNLLPDLVMPPFSLTGRGWIMAKDPSGSRVDIRGEIIHIPEPTTLLLLGMGGLLIRKRL